MNRILHASRFVFFSGLAALCSHAATPLTDVQMSGSNNQVKSGATFTIKSGATFTIEGGGTLSGTQPLDATLTALAGASTAANKITFWDGVDDISTIDFSPFSQTLLPLSSRASWLNTLMPSSPTAGDLLYFDGTNWVKLTLGTNLSITAGTLNAASAPIDATYVTQGSDDSLTNEFALSEMTTGLMKVTTGTGSLTTATAGTDYVAPGAVTSSGLTMATARILGRTTVSTGAVEELTLSALLDLIGSAAQGDILYRGATSWTRLGAGTSGYYLKTQGAGANPIWDAVTGGGSIGGSTGSTDNALIRADGTGGSTVQSSSATLADTGVLTLATTAAGGLTINNTSTQPPYILLAVSGSNKALFGSANQGGDIVTGSSGGDLVFRTIGSNSIRLSTDNGMTSAVNVNSAGRVLLSDKSDDANGVVQFAVSTSSSGGIGFGSDTNLYRSAADTLTTDDSLRVGGNLVIDWGAATSALPSAITAASTLLRGASATGSGTGSSIFETFGFGANGMTFVARRAGGTRASPAATEADGNILALNAYGYDTTWNVFQKGQYVIRADGLWSGSNTGTYHVFSGTPNGSTTIAEWMRLQGGALRLNTYGAGTLTTDGSGNVTASSDESLKDIQGSFTAGLAALREIQPIAFKWKTTTGMDRSDTYYGFSAQNVMRNVPEAVGMGQDGKLTLQDRALLAVAINAINELRAQNVLLTQLVKDLANTPADKARAQAVLDSINSVDSADKDARSAARKAALEAIVSSKAAPEAAKKQSN